MSEKISNAVKLLVKELKKDNSYYYSWQANIAMSFKDEYNRYCKRYKNRTDIHKIANNAAKNFLNLLMRDIK
jgi:hypothetical protein